MWKIIFIFPLKIITALIEYKEFSLTIISWLNLWKVKLTLNTARNYVSFLIVKQFAKGKSKTPPRKAKPENDLSSYFHSKNYLIFLIWLITINLISKEKTSIYWPDQRSFSIDKSMKFRYCTVLLKMSWIEVKSEMIQHWFLFRNEIDEEDSLSPAAVRMTNRIFRYRYDKLSLFV